VVESGPDDDTVPPQDQFEICLPEQGDVCKAGIAGSSGVGQFNQPSGVAVDSSGSIYVADFEARRVQKFTRDGEFELMLGGEVNKTKVQEREAQEANSEPVTVGEGEENLCPIDPGDECGAAVQGSGQGQFDQFGVGDFITVGPGDKVYVGDQGRIQRFDTAGAYQDECAVPDVVQSLDADSAGNLYAAYPSQFDVLKLSYLAGGECKELQRFKMPDPDEFTHPFPTAVTVDQEGDVYAFNGVPNGNGGTALDRIFEFNAAGNVIAQFGRSEFPNRSLGIATVPCAQGNLLATGAASEASGNAFLRAYGTEPTGCFNALTLPADPVAETAATLNGTVNPGGALTSDCHFEWGATTGYGKEAPCAETPAQIGEGTQPVHVHADISGLQAASVYHFRLRATIRGVAETGPDRVLKTLGPPMISDERVASAIYAEATVGASVDPEGLPTSCHVEYGPDAGYGQSTADVPIGSDRKDHTVTTPLSGLQAGSTYHWRYVCHNTAVLDGGLTLGEDMTLATYRTPQTPPPCPNDALRYGASGDLPDCRAYEMVSPVDKNGADIVSGYPTVGEDPGGYVQVSPDGERVTYTAKFPAFGEGLANSFTFNQYLATRNGGEGWSSEGLNPPYRGHRVPETFPGSGREFMAFTPDLCSAWLLDLQTPPLNPDAQKEAANLYRRDNCGVGTGDFETLIPISEATAPTGPGGAKYVNQYSVEGVAADGAWAIFRAKAKLTKDATAGEKAQLYDRVGGALRLVSILPGGSPDPSGAAVGSGWGGGFPSNLLGAVSGDGSLVYWTGTIKDTGEGKLYVRRHAEQGKVSGECDSKGAKACTIAVSAGANAFFWQASPDGAKALYSEGENLFEFDLATKSSQLLAEGLVGVAGASRDLARVYLVSREALASGAAAGKPNLYLAQGGSFTFIATLSEGDVGAVEPGAVEPASEVAARNSFWRATRVTPDGNRIAFESRERLGEFDNTAAGGAPAVEVYAYQAGGQLVCVSCNPSGARPAARELPEPYKHPWEATQKSRITNVQAAAWIPTWERPLHASNVLSADGKRLFFNANDALLPRDSNGAQDVYEWEAAGSGSCNAEAADYFAQNGGCLYLISSGESSFESEFWEASPDGANVFFNTASSLLPQDPGSIDLYDARVEGGFPQPIAVAGCEGEACQSPPAPPSDPTPSSSSFDGAGNVVEPHRRGCPKRRVRRHGKCVRKHRRHHRAGQGRRAKG
jgi:hypothetical protein